MRRVAPWLLAALLFVAAWPPFGPGLVAIAAFAFLAAGLEGLAPRRAFGATWLWLTLSAIAVCPWFPDALTEEYAKNVLATHHPSHVPVEVDAAVRQRWEIVVDRPGS